MVFKKFRFLEDVLDLINYFDRTYVRGDEVIRKGGYTEIRRKPNFPSEQWNVYNDMANGMDCTNNVIEGQHNAMRIIL